MSATSLVYYSSEVDMADLNVLDLFYIINYPAFSIVPDNNAALLTKSGFTSQSQIDNFLGTTDEFDVTAFNAAAVGGGDTIGIIINMDGQADLTAGFVAYASYNPEVLIGIVASAAAAIVTVTSPAHGLSTGNIITAFGASGFTTSSFVDGTAIPITVTDVNTFTFTAPGGAPGGGPGTLNYVVSSPNPGVIAVSTYSVGRGVPTLVPSTPQNAVSVGAYGNIGVKIIATGIDTFISGQGVMSLKIFWKPK